MKQERITEIAAEFMPFLTGDNDAIADNPKRWHEEMTSWSGAEAAGVVAALIHKAVTEAVEECAKLIDRKGQDLTNEYCHGDAGPDGYTWTNKEAEWQVILLDELLEEMRALKPREPQQEGSK